uniref:Uncharacterized protein n=1 Tax=Bracon brevicornis TaxID=1563983 RepID=A0A6V7LYS1_9HYME
MLKAKYRYDSESEVGGECCSPVNQRQRVAHNATRKRAGNITSWELHRSVSVNSHKEQTLSILALFRFTNYLNVYIGVIRRCATCMMGMMGMFKWLRK